MLAVEKSLLVSEPPEPSARDVVAGSGDIAARQESALAPLSVVAHDLRAPLAALALASESLATDLEVLDAQQVREMVSVIQRGAVWMHGLVENVLCAATIREGHLRLQRHPVDLLDAVTRVGPLIEPLLLQKAQHLRLSLRAAPVYVSADGRRLDQVLMNLVLNASKFSAVGQSIDLRLTPRGQYVRVTVADRGPGVPPGGAKALFAPFARGAAPPPLGAEGMGLGLAIVRAIIAAHGGRVGAENRPGGGACFWVELPVLPLRAPPGAGRETIQEGRR